MKTSQHSTRQTTLDELILSAEDSLVNHSAPPEKEKELTMSATCGKKCSESYARFPRPTLWGKTFVDSLTGMTGWYSKRCALTWKMKGTKSFRLYFQLLPSTLPTDATECGLLLTPTTMERAEDPVEMRARAEAKGYKNGTKYNSLKSQILYGNFLPTPRTTDVEGGVVKGVKKGETGYYRENKKGERWGVKLRDVVENGMLPTPTTSCQKAGTAVERTDGVSRRSELNHLMSQRAGQSSQLNPLFVEEMMGFPENWTLLPFLNGEKNQSKPTETP